MAGAGPDAIMSVDDLKPLLLLAKRQPVSCAVGMTGDKEGVVLLARLLTPRRALALLKSKARAARLALDNASLRFGRADVDAASDSTTVRFTINKAAPAALRPKLRHRLRPAHYQHVEIVVDAALEQEPEEAGPEETAAGASSGTARTDTDSAAPADTAPDGVPTDAAARLRSHLARLAAQIGPATAGDSQRRTALTQLALAAQTGLNTNDLRVAAAKLGELRAALQAVPTRSTTPSAQPSDGPGPQSGPSRDTARPGAAAGDESDLTRPVSNTSPPPGAARDAAAPPVDSRATARPGMPTGVPAVAGTAQALAQHLGIDPASFAGREAQAAAVMARLRGFRSLPPREQQRFGEFMAAQGFAPDTRFFRDCMARALDAQTGNPAWAQGVDPLPPDTGRLDRLTKAVRAAATRLGGEAEAQLLALLEPQNLAIMTGFFVVFLAVQATPAGWVADALGGVLVLGTALAVGVDVISILGHLDRFITIVDDRNGNPEEAGAELAAAVADVGVGAFVALVLHSAGRAAKAGARYVRPSAGQADVITSERGLVRMSEEQAARLSVGASADAAGRAGEAGASSGISRRAALRTDADPARRVLGPAAESHPAEVAAMVAEFSEAGVELVYRENVMAYSPSPSPGRPGRVILDPQASYSAWLHEHQQFLDDRAAGWIGLRVIENPELRIQMERNAYQREIDLMRRLGHDDVATDLERNLQEEVQRITREEGG